MTITPMKARAGRPADPAAPATAPGGPGYELIDGPHYDPLPARRHDRTVPRFVYAAVPVLAVNTCAFLGQLGYLHAHLLTWGLAGQILVAFTLESVAVYLSYHAHVARLADDSSSRLQLAAYALAALIGAMNYSHWAGPGWHPTPIAVTFALMSTLSPWLWGVHSRRESRDALKARKLIEDHSVRLGATRWTWHPVRSVRVMFRATWEGITDPAEAIAADNAAMEARKAADLPAAEIDAALLAAMTARDRLIWAWGVIGSTDIGKAKALLASKGAKIDESHARTIRKQLDTARAAAITSGGQP